MRYIHARVVANAKQEFLKEKKKDHFEISVREKAERNMANTRVVQIVAEHFKILRNKVRIVNGHQSPSKLLAIED